MKKFKFCLIIDDDHLSNIISENSIFKNGIAEQIKSLLSVESAIEFLESLVGSTAFPDLIFLDIHFPTDQDGWDFLEHFSEAFEDKQQNLQLYLLTSSISKKDIEKATAYKMVEGFISKPLTKEKILNLFKD